MVSACEGNEVKLSKYLRLTEGGGNGKQGEKGARELRKLEWDMNDGKGEDMAKNSKLAGRGSSKVKQ